MKDRRVLPLLTLVMLIASLTTVQSQGLMGGFKGHHHNRGTGAVELLLATGILAKLLNHRAKHGASAAGRHILHALIGGPRYPPRHPYGRFPMDIHGGGHPSLLQEDLLEPHASMAMNLLPDADLMLNQESALFSAKAPMAFMPTMGMLTESQLLAEAQLSQQLIAARRARKLMEARKLLAAQEAKNILVAQREAGQLLAAQEALQTSALLAAHPSRQILTSAPPPPRMIQHHSQNHHQAHQAQNVGAQQLTPNMMTAEASKQMRAISARADELMALNPGLDEDDAAQILANLHLV
ncbi:uncharacterized protein LOC129235111 [Uloborus diversus]|uniref:uncharacterized protein LOC129235111 n=1 Tax=Uloborus diversus TaxID=327109 RepID=UPI002409E026|nr:uncharacterized protein LOC129235111 [Uloborus diversus]